MSSAENPAMRTIGAKEQRAIEEAAAAAGTPPAVLMRRAGKALAERILSLRAERGEEQVAILCGAGNNGGDGYAAAVFLHEQNVALRLYESENAARAGGPDAQAFRAACLARGIQPELFKEYVPAPGIILDAVFGSGFRADRPVSEEFRQLVARVQEARARKQAYVLSADLPSGVQADNGSTAEAVIPADETLCFICPKTGVYSYPGRKFTGRINMHDLGLGETFINEVWEREQFCTPSVLTSSEVSAWRPARAADSHKGSFGRLAVLAGSVGLAGAAVLAGRAALTAGVGYVDLLVPEQIYPAVLTAVPSVLSQPLPKEAGERLALWRESLLKCSAALAGPGLGANADRELILAAAAEAPRLVLDADALNLLGRLETLESGRAALKDRQKRGLEPAVLTPHPGEFSRLCPEYADLVALDRINSAAALARLTGSAVVLKGAGTVSAFPIGLEQPEIWINSTGNAGMAKAGSGDVLSGLLASFLAQKLPLKEAVLSAVFLHGLSADIRAGELTERALTPEDILEGLPAAFRQAGWDK